MSKSDLVPVVSYPKVICVVSQQLVLDASHSYDPEANVTGTQDVPIDCKWTCPDYLYQPCQDAVLMDNNCLMFFYSTDILMSANYSSLIVNKPHLFTLTITKDTRVNYAYIYVTIVETN